MSKYARVLCSRLVSFVFLGWVAASSWLPLSSPAHANPIPVYACCLPDGICIEIDEDGCEYLGGFSTGWYYCEPDPCLPPLAACCMDWAGFCCLVSEAACEYGEGAWGQGPSCDPNPCVCAAPDPAERRSRVGSWGVIKSFYRQP